MSHYYATDWLLSTTAAIMLSNHRRWEASARDSSAALLEVSIYLFLSLAARARRALDVNVLLNRENCPKHLIAV